jgi:hypothetical protein
MTTDRERREEQLDLATQEIDLEEVERIMSGEETPDEKATA